MNRLLRQKITDGALLVLAILAGSVVAFTHHWQNNRPSADPSGPFVPALAETQPSSLALVRDGQSVQVVNRGQPSDSSEWFVESPWKRSGEPATLDAAVAALRDMQIVRKLDLVGQPTRDDLARLGLDHPNFSWQVVIEGFLWSFAFGANAPEPRGGTYVDVTPPGSSTHQFYVVRVDLSKLSLRPEQLIEPRLVPYVPSELSTITLESGSSRANFHFEPARSRWFEAEGRHYRVLRTAFDSFLLQLTTLKAEHFLSPSEAAAKHFMKKSASVTLGLQKSHSTIRLDFDGPCEGDPASFLVTVAGSEDFTVCADTRALLASMDGGVSTWSDSCVFSVRADEIESLDEQCSGHSMHLERWESAFRITGTESRPVELASGNRVLESMLSTCGILANPSAQGVPPFDDKNFIRVRSAVIGDTDRYEERVLVGPALANGDRYVKRETDGAVLRIPRSDVAALLPEERQLTSSKPAREPLVDAGAE